MTRTLIIAIALFSGMLLAAEAQAGANTLSAKAPAPPPHCCIISYWGTPVFGRVCR
jgi:hypothetical protein